MRTKADLLVKAEEEGHTKMKPWTLFSLILVGLALWYVIFLSFSAALVRYLS